MRRPRPTYAIAAALAVLALSAARAGQAVASSSGTAAHAGKPPATTTPIQHLIVIFDEKVSFDHYFGTYPYAATPRGDPPCRAPLR